MSSSHDEDMDSNMVETRIFYLEMPSAFFGRGIVECTKDYRNAVGNERILTVKYRLEKVGTNGVRGLITMQSISNSMLFGDAGRHMKDITVVLKQSAECTPRAVYDTTIRSRRYFVDTGADGSCSDGMEIGFLCPSAPAIAPSWTRTACLLGFAEAQSDVVLYLPLPINPHIFLKRDLDCTPDWTEPRIRNSSFYIPMFKILDDDEESEAASHVSVDKLVIKASDGYMVIPCNQVLTNIDRNFHKDSPMHVLREEEMVEEARKVGGGVWDASANYDIATLVAFAWRYLVFRTPCAVNINTPEHPDLMARTTALAGLLGYIPVPVIEIEIDA